jgi:hypothetical protein
MKIAVCIKQVVTREWQLRVNEAKTWIRDQEASFELNEPDAYALEEALRLKEKHGGEVVVCSAGPARATQVIREALARGADRAIHVEMRWPPRSATSSSTWCSPGFSRTTRDLDRWAWSWRKGSACLTRRSSWRCKSPTLRQAQGRHFG